MRIGWIGSHAEGVPALRAVVAAGYEVAAALTLRQDLAARRSGAVDYAPICRELGILLHRIANVNDPASLDLLASLELDLVFVIGWSQIVRAEALRLARIGMIGAHASLLPLDRGRAPINWALIRGDSETGNSLIWLAEDVDTGDIIDQRRIPITPYDTCATLYERVAETNAEMIVAVLPRLLAGERPGRRQEPDGRPPLPGRRPEDGRIDWAADAGSVYDFVRALARPYPGAFGTLGGRTWRVWRAALLPDAACGGAPGEVLGAVVSPTESACGQAVACGRGAVVLLELEADDGEILAGRALSDRQWTGKAFGHGE